jgi:ureidoglycolate hydrolase
MNMLQPVRITSENFRFGSVVNAQTGIPTAEGPTFKFWSDIANYRIDGNTEIGLCTVYRDDARPLDMVERHLYTPELLIPIDTPFVLPIADDSNTVHAYTVEIGEAVVIDPGVWHGPCLPVGKDTATYYVIFRKGTPAEDVEKKDIEPVTIKL